MKIITINSPTHGIHEVLVDDEYYDMLNAVKWVIRKNEDCIYAQHSMPYPSSKKGQKAIQMHRVILGLRNPKIFVDHKDRNGLNNQKNNLRACTTSENNKNRKSVGASKYLGVGIKVNKTKTYWRATISVNNKGIYLGVFKDEEAAARAYDEAAKIHHGEFANLNFK